MLILSYVNALIVCRACGRIISESRVVTCTCSLLPYSQTSTFVLFRGKATTAETAQPPHIAWNLSLGATQWTAKCVGNYATFQCVVGFHRIARFC